MTTVRILWVEDNAHEITAVLASLRAAGHIVTHVASRGRACHRLRAGEEFDGIVLDQRMPDTEVEEWQSGEQLYNDIRRGEFGERHRTVPIIFATGYAEQIRKTTHGDPPPSDVLIKPITVEGGVERVLHPIVRYKARRAVDALFGAVGRSCSLRIEFAERCVANEWTQLKVAIGEIQENDGTDDVEPPIVAYVSAHRMVLAVRHQKMSVNAEEKQLEATFPVLPESTGRQSLEVEVFLLAERVAYAVIETEVCAE